MSYCEKHSQIYKQYCSCCALEPPVSEHKDTEMLAIDDREAAIKHIALRWDNDIECWRILTVGRNIDEFNERVAYWKGKGAENIKTYSVKEDKP